MYNPLLQIIVDNYNKIGPYYSLLYVLAKGHVINTWA